MDDPFASHLPVLRRLTALLMPQSVLEFGAGIYSTPFFLSFPWLERLVSVEPESDWYVSLDERHSVTSRRRSPEGFDLVFIDDGCSSGAKTGVAERIKTIRYVLTRPHPVVAIHDAEVSEYMEAIRSHTDFPVSVYPTAPDTAVIWPK